MQKPTKPIKPKQIYFEPASRTEHSYLYPYVETATKKLVLLNSEEVPDYWGSSSSSFIDEFESKYNDQFKMTFDVLKKIEALLPCDPKDIEIFSYEKVEDIHALGFIQTKHLTDEEYNEKVKLQKEAESKNKEELKQYGKKLNDYAVEVQKWKAKEAKAKLEKLQGKT